MAGSSNNSFAEEICDQFLVCRMCSEIYTSPKVLTCMHTFCEKCIETHYDMEEQERPYRFLLYTRALTCPLCHTRTELPTGGVHRLPDNFLVANLADVVNRRKPCPKNPVCEICKPAMRNEADKIEDQENRAVSKCLDCVKLLCRSCVELHRRTRVTQKHSLFDVKVEKDIECKLHQKEPVRFYCEPCEECICVLCTFHDHRDHEVTSLLEALNRHRGPFETLMDRCRGRIEGLRDQVELIEGCERGLKLAEEHIRDSAIESIAAIRKKEKDLLSDLRETLDEQTLDFIGEKNTFKENLKNLEGTFNLTNAMLKGTKIDLLIVKKEMEKKLTAILDGGVKNIPESLKISTQFREEDYYQDIRKTAFDEIAKSDRFISRTGRNEAAKTEIRRRAVEVHSVGTETDDDLSRSRTAPTSNDFASKLESENEVEDEIQDDDVMPGQNSRRDSGWQRPMAVVVVTEIPRTLGTITLRPIRGPPRTRDAFTQMERVVLVEGSTEMPCVAFLDKETNTPCVHVLQKSVSTDNQTMVDKSTSTLVVDVTAAYRGASTTKRTVMVSRGTCTPRMMMMDKETLSVPSAVSTRGCSPVVWVNNNVQENAIPGQSTVTIEECGGRGTAINSLIQGSSNPAICQITSDCPQVEKAITQSSVVKAIIQSPIITEVTATEDSLSASKAMNQPLIGQVKLPTHTSVATGRPNSSPLVATVSISPQNTLITQAKTSQESVGRQGENNFTQNSGNITKVQIIPAAQGGAVLTQCSIDVSRPQFTSGNQGGQVLTQGSMSVPRAQTIPVTQGVQVITQGIMPVSKAQSIPGTKESPVPTQGPVPVPRAQSIPGAKEGQVLTHGPMSVTRAQTTPVTQGGQALTQGAMTVSKAQSIPGIQVPTHGPVTVPRAQSIPGSKEGQVLTQGPMSVIRAQSIPVTQGGQIITQGLTPVPKAQSIPGTQTPTQGSVPIPRVQSMLETQGSQVLTQDLVPVPRAQSISGPKEGQVLTPGPMYVPKAQTIPAAQGVQACTQGAMTISNAQSIPGTQVPTQGPVPVPRAQSIPGSKEGQVLTQGPMSVIRAQSIPVTQAGQILTQCHVPVPTAQSIHGDKGGQVLTQGSKPVPRAQSIYSPEGQILTQSPISAPRAQSIPGTQGSQVFTQGRMPVPIAQTIPLAQGQVLTQGCMPGHKVQTIPETQGCQTLYKGPVPLPRAQSITGVQGGQIITQGHMPVPNAQSILEPQGGNVLIHDPTSVPKAQSIPGIEGCVRTFANSTAITGTNNQDGIQKIHISNQAYGTKAVEPSRSQLDNDPFRASVNIPRLDCTVSKGTPPQATTSVTKPEGETLKSQSNVSSGKQIQNSATNLPTNISSTNPAPSQEQPKPLQTMAVNLGSVQTGNVPSPLVLRSQGQKIHQNNSSQVAISNQYMAQNSEAPTSYVLVNSTAANTNISNLGSVVPPRSNITNVFPVKPMVTPRTPAPAQILETILGSRAPSKSNLPNGNVHTVNQNPTMVPIVNSPSTIQRSQVPPQTGVPASSSVQYQNHVGIQSSNLTSHHSASNAPKSIPIQRPIGVSENQLPIHKDHMLPENKAASQDNSRISTSGVLNQVSGIVANPKGLHQTQGNAVIPGSQTYLPANTHFPAPAGIVAGQNLAMNLPGNNVSSQ